MALTLEYMRNLVRNRLDDEDFEATYLDSSLNQAQWKILNKRKLTFLERTSSKVLANGSNAIKYPTNIKDLLSIRVSADGIQTYDITENFVDYADFQMSRPNVNDVDTRQPLFWTTFANEMRFPANADKDYTITIDYVKKSEKLVEDTDEFDIPEEFEEVLMIGAYMRIAKREDDYDVKNQEKIDYDDGITDMVRNYTRNLAPRRKHVMRTMGR